MFNKGPFLVFIASIVFGIVAALVKISTMAFPAEEIVFARFFIGLLALFVLIVFKIVKLEFRNWYLHLVRGILGAFAITFYFKALAHIPLSDAVVLSFTYPIFTISLAFVFLKEKIHLTSVLGFLAAIIGIIIIVNPAVNLISDFNVGYLYGLASSFFAGITIVLIKKLRTTDSSLTIVFSFFVIGSSFSLFTMIGKVVIPDVIGLILLTLIALSATLGQIFMTYAYRYCRASEGSIISLFTVVVAMAFSLLLFHEGISLRFLAGTVLIGTSVFYLLHSHPMHIES